jgi:hypothetical protein
MIPRNSSLRVAPKLIPLYLFLLVATLVGCVSSLQTLQTETTKTDETASTTETDESPGSLAELQLSTPKTRYAVKEDIPLELNIQNGKFDLLVPFFQRCDEGCLYTSSDKGRERANY